MGAIAQQRRSSKTRKLKRRTHYKIEVPGMRVCENCGEKETSVVAEALFTCLGYSTPEDDGYGIAIGYTINNEAIKAYEKISGKTLKYGVFAVLKDKLGGGNIFDENGKVIPNAIAAEVSNDNFVAVELKITGFTDEYKDIKLAMGAFVKVTDEDATEYSYMQGGIPASGEKYFFVSYNDISKIISDKAEIIQ